MQVRGKVSDRGRIIVPAPMRRSLGLEPGSDIVLREHNGELRVISLKQAVRQIQALASERVPKDESLVDELLNMRRAEVKAFEADTQSNVAESKPV